MKNCMNAWKNQQYVDAITYCKPLANPTDHYDPKASYSDNVKKMVEALYILSMVKKMLKA